MPKRSIVVVMVILLSGLLASLGGCGGGSQDPVNSIDDPGTGTQYNGTGIEVTTNDSGQVSITTTHLNDDTVYTYDVHLTDQLGHPLSQMKVYYLESGTNSVIIAHDPLFGYTPAIACGAPAELKSEFDQSSAIARTSAMTAAAHFEVDITLVLASIEQVASTFVFPSYAVSTFFITSNVASGQDYTQTCRDFEELAVDLAGEIDGNALFKALVVQIDSVASGQGARQQWAMLRNDILGQENMVSAIQAQLVQQTAQNWSLTAADLSTRRVTVKSFFDGSNIPSSIRNLFTIVEIGEDTSICSGIGAISGTVTDATTGLPISGVRVSMSGAVGGVSYTDATGAYSYGSLPDGDYTISISKSGYIGASKQVTIDGGPAIANFVITEVLSESQYRFVLLWDSLPVDLDAHAWSGDDHIFYMDKGADTIAPYIALDIDDITSYGPETITVSQLTETVQYAVFNYSGMPNIAGSGATVQVYRGSSLLRTYTAPATGSGLYWYVSDLSPTSGLIDQDYVTDTPPGPHYLIPKN